MREKLTISALPVPKRDDILYLKKHNNPDTIKLYWDNGRNTQHFGMVKYAQVFGYDIEGYHSALIAERRGKILCLYRHIL